MRSYEEINQFLIMPKPKQKKRYAAMNVFPKTKAVLEEFSKRNHNLSYTNAAESLIVAGFEALTGEKAPK